jgi:hypothetical protein
MRPPLAALTSPRLPFTAAFPRPCIAVPAAPVHFPFLEQLTAPPGAGLYSRLRPRHAQCSEDGNFPSTCPL